MSKDPFHHAVRVTLARALFHLDAARIQLERTPLTAAPDDVTRAYALLHEARDTVRLITAAVDVRAVADDTLRAVADAAAQPSLFPKDR